MNHHQCIVVTPAGRKRYLRILLKNLEKQRSDFDRWHLWLNTNVPEDVEYIESLPKKHDWIIVVRPKTPVNSVDSRNIHGFFEYAREPHTVYIRLDDDIVYLDPDFIKKLRDYRRQNPEPFLVYGNIINNAIVSHLHQRNQRFQYPQKSGYECMDPVGWSDPAFARAIHDAFLRDLESGVGTEAWTRSFSLWHLWDQERVSINCISWIGSDMPRVQEDEEQFLSVEYPRMKARYNVILGDAICSHFAFYTQRSLMDTTNILERYEKVLEDED